METMDILRSPYFWIFSAGILIAFITWRLANRWRDQAAFADLPEDQQVFEMRARIAVAIFAVGMLASFSSLGIFLFELYEPETGFQLPDFFTAQAEPDPTPTPIPESTPTTAASQTEAEEGPGAATQPPPESENPPAASSSGPTGSRVIGNTNFRGLNMREGPTLEAGILAKLMNGTVVHLLGEPVIQADGYLWVMIELDDGREGWVAARYLIDPLADPGE